MTVSPFILKELRYVAKGSSFSTSFTAANASGWTGATKLRAHNIEFSPVYESQKDATVQTRTFGRPANIPTIRKGELKFRMYLEGGSATTAAPAVATLLSKVWGGLKSPTLISDLCEANTSPSIIQATSHGQVVGQGVLVGVRGDGRAEGKAGVIEVLTSANAYELQMALPAYPTVGDVIKNGHTVYCDDTAENYLDFLLIGHYAGTGATDDPDQINCVGCAGTASLGGFKPGELPFVEFMFQIGDWRNEPYATKASLQKTVAGVGNNPAGNQAMGALCIGDATSYTRTTVQGGDIEVNPNITLTPIMDLNGSNGHGGWRQVPSDTGAVCNVTRYWGDMPGMYDDFLAPTAKQILIQWGHEAQKTVLIDMQRAYLDSLPERVEYEKNMGLKMAFHADSGQATELTTDDMRLQDSPIRIHFL